MVSKRLIEQLKFEEGFREKVYLDTKNISTIGYGHNLIANPTYKGVPIPLNITKVFAEELLIDDISKVISICEKKMLMSGLNQARKDAIYNMVFQLGINGFLRFRNMRNAIDIGNWGLVEKEGLNSVWAKKDSPQRALRVISQLASGKYYDVQ